MLGTGMMPRQTGQGNTAKRKIPMNGLNPTTESVLPVLPKNELRTGAETSLELAGQNPEVAAQQAEQIVEDESQNFNKREFEELFGATIKAIGEIYNLVQVQNANRIREEVLSIAMPLAEEAGRLSIETSAKIREVLSNNSGSTQDPNKSPLGFFGPNTPSKQNPQGPVSAA
jgi:hypothetical protein